MTGVLLEGGQFGVGGLPMWSTGGRGVCVLWVLKASFCGEW